MSSSHISTTSVLSLATLALIYISSTAAEDNFLQTQKGSKICVGDDSNALYYFECCGSLFNDCCFRFQTWVIVVLVVLGLIMLVSFIIGLIRCICCCD